MKFALGLLTCWLAASVPVTIADVGKILGTLETSEYQLQVLVGDTKPMYNVLSTNGEVLAEGISKKQLAKQWPLLGELAESGVADGAGLSLEHQQVPEPAERSEFIDLR